MRIEEHMQLIQDMVEENPDALGVMIPSHSVEALLEYAKDRKKIRKKFNQERTRANWYKEALDSANAEIKRLKGERIG